MLDYSVGNVELWDEQKEEFLIVTPQIVHLEHSLAAISEWEATWEKPFFSGRDEVIKTKPEMKSYIQCMTTNKDSVDPIVYDIIMAKGLPTIDRYMNAKRTATVINKKLSSPGEQRSSEGITSELIYYWMVSFGIPFDAETWHINRLLTLITVCSLKNKPPKKMDRREQLEQQYALNEARRKKLHTSG